MAEAVDMLEIAEEIVGEGGDGMEVEELVNDLVYEEVVQEHDEHEALGAGECEDKENAESDVADTEFLEDENGIMMEITRRRISQDREGNCYWYIFMNSG